jgi:addiction module HigA family antidote
MRIRTHPGEVLRYDYLEPLKMSASALAEKLDVPANRITDIVRGRRNMTADTALRLAKCFDTTPEFWMDLQTAHDLSKAELAETTAAVKVLAEALGAVVPQSSATDKAIAKKLLRSRRKSRSRKPAVVRSKRTGTHG